MATRATGTVAIANAPIRCASDCAGGGSFPSSLRGWLTGHGWCGPLATLLKKGSTHSARLLRLAVQLHWERTAFGIDVINNLATFWTIFWPHILHRLSRLAVRVVIHCLEMSRNVCGVVHPFVVANVTLPHRNQHHVCQSHGSEGLERCRCKKEQQQTLKKNTWTRTTMIH